jgi:hypothetical protein
MAFLQSNGSSVGGSGAWVFTLLDDRIHHITTQKGLVNLQRSEINVQAATERIAASFSSESESIAVVLHMDRSPIATLPRPPLSPRLGCDFDSCML